MSKSIHWFMNKNVVKRGTSWALLLLVPFSIIKFHPKSVSLLVFFRSLKIYMRNLTYYLTVNVLMLVVLNTLPGSSILKVPSMMNSNTNWSTGIHIRNGPLAKQSRDMSLVLVERLMDIFRRSIPFSKTFKLAWRNITWIILEIFNCWQR